MPRAWWIFWLFVLGVMMLVLAVLTPPLDAQVSPGLLSRAHHNLDGPTGCVKCHAVSPGSPTFLCLDCHQEIAARLKQKRGLHPAFMAEPKASCVRCHSEHNGINFSLLHWDSSPAKFNHAATGFCSGRQACRFDLQQMPQCDQHFRCRARNSPIQGHKPHVSWPDAKLFELS